eukprot:jgi/Mesvir1/15553/Mv26138-RA.2
MPCQRCRAQIPSLYNQHLAYQVIHAGKNLWSAILNCYTMVGTMLQPGLDTERSESGSELEARHEADAGCAAAGNAATKALSQSSRGVVGSGPAYEIVFARNNVCVHPLTGKRHARQFIPGRLSPIKLNEVLFLTWLPYAPPEPSPSEDAFVLLNPTDATSLQGEGVGKTDVSIDVSSFCSGDEG